MISKGEIGLCWQWFHGVTSVHRAITCNIHAPRFSCLFTLAVTKATEAARRIVWSIGRDVEIGRLRLLSD